MQITPPNRAQHDTLPKKGMLFLTITTPLVLITRLLTGQADIPVNTAVQIKHHKLNMITHITST